LYRVFSRSGNPKLTNLRLVLHSLGLELAIQPYNQARKN
jgi:DNA-binding phage protein